MRRLLRNWPTSATIAVVAAVLTATPATAQESWDPGRVYMTREELQSLLSRLELTAQSPAYSSALRERTRDEAELIRTRLAEGDFQVGDRILLDVEGEEVLSDTFFVERGRLLDLPLIGEMPLSGLLRSELEATLTEFLGRFLIQPNVTARSMIPVTLAGAVTNPGFYTLPSEIRLTDALMAAGGTTGTAEITAIRIERGSEEIWDREALREAITAGRTLDQLSMRAGDLVFVPDRGDGIGGAESSVRTISYILSIPLTIVALISIF